MDSDKIEKHLHELKNEIFVDQDFKKQLRQTFVKKKRSKFHQRAWFSALVAAAIFFAVFFSDYRIQEINASAFNIHNAISFFDVGRGEITSHTYDGETLYVSIKNEGIYSYSSNGYVKITEDTADSLTYSPHLESLLFTQDGDIFIYHVKTKLKEKIMSGSYSQIVAQSSQIIYATEVFEDELTILELNLKTNKEKVISKGSHPSFNKKENKIVFERDGEIIIRDHKGKEIVADIGKDPSVSKDGSYISYIKENAGFEDVWIIDFNLETKRKVTTNPPSRDNKKVGIYKYQSPVWGSGDRSIYVLKKNSNEETSRIMMISLSEKEKTSIETVESYLQSLIIRDDDYAMSLMDHPPEFLTYANPHQIGYLIRSLVEDGDLAKVTADVYWTDTALPFYQITTFEFSLHRKDGHYSIKSITEKGIKEISAFNNEQVQLFDNGQAIDDFFHLYDIPKSLMSSENIRISSLVISHNGKDIIFSLQEMDHGSSVTILKYEIETKSFSILTTISSEKDEDTVMEQISMNSTGQYIAVDVTIGENSKVVVLDLTDGKKVQQFNNHHTVFWQKDFLLMEEININHSSLYQYNPTEGIKRNF